ncbi:MAG: Crp/Fnr family transcriptional regulator [Butyricicoccus pullicaecorum]|nr:Crp/Fnr family transcriptional regulator [Butyricicoccus pullicaecorum]
MQDFLLGKNALFRGIEPQEMEALMHCLRPLQRSYQKNEVIWQEGDRVHTVGMVARGKVLILRDDFWGNRSILGEAAAGDIFGESYACAPGQPVAVSVLAAEDTTVVFLEIAQAMAVCGQACTFHLRLIQNLMQILAQKNLMLSRKIDHISRRTTREKLLAYLSYHAQVQGSSTFDIPFNRQELADYLSVDRSALSQELGKMKRDGLVDFSRSHFTLLSGDIT